MIKKILFLMNKYPEITESKISEKLDISLKEVKLKIKELEKSNNIIVNEGYSLTKKAKKQLEMVESKKIKNAVILAAGISRDFEYPNGFVMVGGEPLVEKSIKNLLNENIERIYIVVGYKKEYYQKLAKKYSEIKLIENSKFEQYSSYFSLKLLEKYLDSDFLLLDSDIIYEKKALKKILSSKEKNIILISSETGSKDECYVETENDYLLKMSKDKNELKIINGEMLGISRISYPFFKKINELKVTNPNYAYEYSLSDISRKSPIKVLKINEFVWGEVDTREQYNRIIKEIYPRIKKNEESEKIEEIKNLLVSTLDIKKLDIDEIEVLGGMTNKNYLVTINNKKYVLRIPGNGTSGMINRYFEKINIEQAILVGIDKKFIYFNENTGVKISEYIENAETLNPETSKKIENLFLTSNLLRKLHTSNIKFENNFDVFDEIIKYEKLIKNEKTLEERYEKYLINRKKIFDLKGILLKNGYRTVACHNDTIPENFIKNKRNEIFLIDWEYSGMNDPMWDLAAHSLEVNLSKEMELFFLENYFNKKLESNEKLRIEIYKILQDFLWSIWTVVKEEMGEEFGSYGIDRYNRGILKLEEIVKNEI